MIEMSAVLRWIGIKFAEYCSLDMNLIIRYKHIIIKRYKLDNSISFINASVMVCIDGVMGDCICNAEVSIENYGSIHIESNFINSTIG